MGVARQHSARRFLGRVDLIVVVFERGDFVRYVALGDLDEGREMREGRCCPAL